MCEEMKLPKYKLKRGQKTAFNPLLRILGERVRLTKVSERGENKLFVDIIQEYKLTGYLQLYDRGGGPALFISSLSEWYATSWVQSVKKANGGVEVTTENSIYLLRTV